jgi:hypothetical protein
MELLLMAQEKIPACKTPGALWTLERLLLGVGPLVPFQVLQSRKGAGTCPTDMGPGLVRLRGRKARRGLLRGFWFDRLDGYCQRRHVSLKL